MSGVGYGTKLGMLTFAIGLTMGAFQAKGQNAYSSAELGNQILYRLKHHYQQAAGHGRSNAAHFKRASRKSRNIAKHPRAAHKCGEKVFRRKVA